MSMMFLAIVVVLILVIATFVAGAISDHKKEK
jgi:hypothetical protein